MQEEISFEHFETFGLRLQEAREHRSDGLVLTFYYEKEGIKKIYPVSESRDLYRKSVFEEEPDRDGICRACAEEGASFVHSEVGFEIHKECRDDFESMVIGFMEESPSEVVSKMI